MKLTKKEFFADFAKLLGVEKLPEFIDAEECDCGAPNCDGWWLTFDKEKALGNRVQNKTNERG
ncbi:MAG: hypothetical protein WCS96_07900 [Victivallales bacterium]